MTDNPVLKPKPGELTAAISRNDAKAVEDLLLRGADVEEEDERGWGALRLAAYEGFTEVACLLLDGGADVNKKTEYGLTPLMAAGLMGRVDTARLLLERGAEINAVCKSNSTALMCSTNGNKIGTVRLLIENGADITVRDILGQTAQERAEKRGEKEIARLLKEAPEIQRNCAAVVRRAAVLHKQQKLRGLQARIPKPVIIRGPRS